MVAMAKPPQAEGQRHTTIAPLNVDVRFAGRSKGFQYGYRMTGQASLASRGDRPGVNTGACQPFTFHQPEKGLYLRSASVWVYNLENDAYGIPWTSDRSSSRARTPSGSSSRSSS